MSARKLSALIIDSTGLSALTRTMQRLAALQQLYVACTPVELALASRVVNNRNGELVITADNSAIAAKLRQLAPRLLKNLQKQSGEVTGIRIEVQVTNAAAPGSGAQTSKNTLPIDFIDNFENLARQVKDPGLRAALAKFAAKQRKKP